MGIICRGICEQFRVRIASKQPRYSVGYKRCTFCAAYFSIPDSRCPCCKTKLRTRARSKLKFRS